VYLHSSFSTLTKCLSFREGGGKSAKLRDCVQVVDILVGLKSSHRWHCPHARESSAQQAMGRLAAIIGAELNGTSAGLGYLEPGLDCIKQRLFLALHFIHVYFSALLHLITIP
jgi:hypothetical protein